MRDDTTVEITVPRTDRTSGVIPKKNKCPHTMLYPADSRGKFICYACNDIIEIGKTERSGGVEHNENTR